MTENLATGPLRSPPAAVLELLVRFRNLLQGRFGARLSELVLFGSHARGTAHDESDVDALVVVRDLSETERREVMDLAYDAARAGEEFIPLSVLPYADWQASEQRARERLLFSDIDREGIRL